MLRLTPLRIKHNRIDSSMGENLSKQSLAVLESGQANKHVQISALFHRFGWTPRHSLNANASPDHVLS